MFYTSGSPRLSRRAVLTLTAAAGSTLWKPVLALGAEFWEKKEPAEWSEGEIRKFLTKSPWAIEADMEMNPNARGGPGGGMGGPPMGGGQMGPIGGPPTGGVGMPPGGIGPGAPGGGMEKPKFIVRWESAKPMREVTRTAIPESFADRYVISVNSGLPMRRRRYEQREGDDARRERNKERQQEMLERMKASTFLQPKDKEPAQPGVVERVPTPIAQLTLFGFAKDLIEITKDDKEVFFTTEMGPFILKAKFKPAEMIYRGELAL